MLKRIYVSGGCSGSACPTLYVTDRESYVVQGWQLSADEVAEVAAPAGEGAVEVPTDVLEAYHQKRLRGEI